MPLDNAAQPTFADEGAQAEPKRVFMRTFGCQMNVYDSERMSEALAAEGYVETSNPADADLAILNTCHIREKAAEKVYSDLGRLRDIKIARGKGGKETVIAVAGCVAQAEGSEIVRRAPAVDLVVGPQSYHRLPELLARLRGGENALVETAFPDEDKFAALPSVSRRSRRRRFSRCRKGAINSARSAWCPTRAAWNIRGPWRRSWTKRAVWSIAA